MTQIASKLANSVRQAKTQRAGQKEEETTDETTKPAATARKPAEEPEAPLPLLPSKRVWPD